MARRSLPMLLIALATTTSLLVAAEASAGVAAEKATWEARFGPFHEIVRQHSVPAPNESALLLDELRQRLEFRESHPRAPTREYFEWYEGEWSQATAGPVPFTVLAWHAEKAAIMDAIRSVALMGDPPVWGQAPCEFSDDDVAAAGVLLELPDALIADAFVAESLGDAVRADSDLEAAWLLVTAQLRRNTVLTAERCSGKAQLIAAAVLKLSSPSPTWSSRLDAAPFRASFAEGMRLQTWCTLTRLKSGWSPEADAGMTGRWLSRRAALHATQADRLIVEALWNAPECGVALLPWRNLSVLGVAITLPDSEFTYVACRADSVGIFFELTHRVLALREAARESGSLPLVLPGGSASTSCPHRAWQWSTDGLTGCLEYVRTDVPPITWLDCLWRSPTFEYTVHLR